MKKIIAFALLLSACGFSPMYKQDVATDIYIIPISGTNGIDLRNALNGKLGVSGNQNARYVLEVKLDNPVMEYKALQKTGDATWQSVRLHATYVLKEGNTEIMRGADSAEESYTFVRYLVAANAAQNNAVQNSIKTLSEKIGTRVLAEVNK